MSKYLQRLSVVVNTRNAASVGDTSQKAVFLREAGTVCNSESNGLQPQEESSKLLIVYLKNIDDQSVIGAGKGIQYSVIRCRCLTRCRCTQYKVSRTP